MSVALVRYGRIPEVARFETGSVTGLDHGQMVVVETHRGVELGMFLERLTTTHPADRAERWDDDEIVAGPHPHLLRVATADDLASASQLGKKASSEFTTWVQRIEEWNLDLQLIDLEWTLDEQKVILYVLSDRGPDCTKLALQAAAAGLATVDVQPVDADGLVTLPSSWGGCGTCGSHDE